MARIFVVIHANSEWNERGLWQGQCDTRLSERGRSMAELLAGRKDLAAIKRIHSSDLRRARETAQPLADRLGLPVICDRGLREGRWQDHHRDADIPLLEADYPYETRTELTKRAVHTLDRIARETALDPILIVTHGTFLECFLERQFPGCRPALPAVRTALNEFEYRAGRWLAGRLNDHSHLPAVDREMLCVTAKPIAHPDATAR